MAVHRGTFTMGHGTKVAAQRVQQISRQILQNRADLPMDPETLRKGKALLGNFNQQG